MDEFLDLRGTGVVSRAVEAIVAGPEEIILVGVNLMIEFLIQSVSTVSRSGTVGCVSFHVLLSQMDGDTVVGAAVLFAPAHAL